MISDILLMRNLGYYKVNFKAVCIRSYFSYKKQRLMQ